MPTFYFFYFFYYPFNSTNHKSKPAIKIIFIGMVKDFTLIAFMFISLSTSVKHYIVWVIKEMGRTGLQ